MNRILTSLIVVSSIACGTVQREGTSPAPTPDPNTAPAPTPVPESNPNVLDAAPVSPFTGNWDCGTGIALDSNAALSYHLEFTGTMDPNGSGTFTFNLQDPNGDVQTETEVVTVDPNTYIVRPVGLGLRTELGDLCSATFSDPNSMEATCDNGRTIYSLGDCKL